MEMRNLKIVGVLALGLMLFVGPTRALAQIAGVTSRKDAPKFALKNDTGTLVRLSDYKGSVVLLNFWATWCHGCKTEIPWYMEFQRKYKQRGLTVIGASMDDGGWKVGEPFVKAKKLNYTVMIANDDLAKQYGLGAMPMSVLIDREGRIADVHSGVVDQNEWEAEIQRLLAERR
jgi:peroxiredoxin